METTPLTHPETINDDCQCVCGSRIFLLFGKRCLILEVCTVLKVVLVMPSTNPMSEYSFSALIRVKSYLRSTMTDSIKSLPSITCAQEFYGLS